MNWSNGWESIRKERPGICYYLHITADQFGELDGPPFLAELVCRRAHDSSSDWALPWSLDPSRIVSLSTERSCAVLGIRSSFELYLMQAPILAPGEEAAFIVPVTRVSFWPRNEGSLPLSH